MSAACFFRTRKIGFETKMTREDKVFISSQPCTIMSEAGTMDIDGGPCTESGSVQVSHKVRNPFGYQTQL